MPEFWEGLPPHATMHGDTATFDVVDSVDILITYRYDYTPLLMLAGAAAALPLIMMRGRIIDIWGALRRGELR